LGKSFFPNVITSPFLLGLHIAFYLSAAICLIAALASVLRGKRYVYGGSQPTNATTVQDVVVAREEAPTQGD
jgi:hypothetical protein